MEPLISVIVPVYNVEPYLRQCVDSILNQTYLNLEVILVDDGSPDQCATICDDYAARDDRIVVIHKTNGGLSDARNAGLDIMTGDYLVFVDSDDWLAENALEVMYQTMVQTDADLVIGKHDRIEDGTSKCFLFPEQTTSLRIMNSEEAMGQMFRQGCAAWARLYKREVHEGIRFPVGEINEDEAIVLRLLECCSKVAEIGRVVYHYRCRPESITTSTFSEKKLAWLRHCRANLAYVQERYPELELAATARYRGSLLWSLREIALSGKDFTNEAHTLRTELKENAALFERVPFVNRGDKLRYYLLKQFSLGVYKLVLRMRHGR